MERNETENAPAEAKSESGGRSCLCGGKKNVMTWIAVWVVVSLGAACFMAYSHFGKLRAMSEAERLIAQAEELYGKQDYKASTECLKRAAELGDPLAQLYYGGSLKKGIGTERDLPAAVAWLRKSADRNFVLAFYELGVCCENGEGVERDLNEAEAWYRKAVEGGFVGPEALQALERVGKLKAESGRAAEAENLLRQAQEAYDREDFKSCAESLKRAAELGHPLAQLYYGGCLKMGIGTKQDMPAAVEWLRKSAGQNFVMAFYQLGVCYEVGEGVERDLNEAEAWYRRAVEGGIEGADASQAIERIAKLKNDEDTEAVAERLLQQAQEIFDRQNDDVACAELLRQAAELGNAGAQLYYGRFLCKGIGTALDPAAAVEWFRKSAAQNCAAAFYELGVCYENGEGVERDFDTALEWYRKALDGGIAETQSAIIRVEKAKALNAAEEK